MAQARDAAFNPSSPHSSTGGADSYKNEGTPDTKLTVFSPGDNSAKPSKLLAALNLSGPFDSTGRFVKPTEAFSSDVSITSEKDPFISSTTVPKKAQKLSPTASAFRPVSVPLPLVAHGSLNGLAAANVGLGANRQLFAPHATPTGRFSHEMGISRFVALSSSASRPITVTDVEDYLATLERLGSPSRGRRTATSIQGKVYLCFSNIRDARGAHENARFGSPDWVADYIKAAEYYKLCHPSGQSEPILDGQLQITAFAQAIGVGIAHVETVVHTFLETQGEIFALQRQSEANEHVFQAAVEFSDADIAISVVQKFNGTTLRASFGTPFLALTSLTILFFRASI
ncbi:37c45b28-bf54-462f-b6d1-7581398aa1e8 [Thermothielavioides terrestris]|uniref:37c45b28-bf54-462f-b6d1-7581398aa1e8 n=1 Tax=Thermothielavioides terrestris TaxID=2587410 RepID=A0A446BJR3_9PEZI|nr:37c45b28-bf54-462f-b6d1-7581398aa1e8 [Thermothielavioides terrestris]